MSSLFHDLLIAQLERTAEAMELTASALALARSGHADPDVLAALDRRLVALEHRTASVRVQLGLPCEIAVH